MDEKKTYRTPSFERCNAVLELMNAGITRTEIAARLGLNIKTVSLYATHARRALGIQGKHSRVNGSLMERFAAKVDKSGEPHPTLGTPCWVWTGTLVTGPGGGYGTIQDTRGELGKRNAFYRTHRAYWMLVKGPIPDGAVLLHRCDNPPCCNPEHIRVGTHMDNIRDAIDKDRFRPQSPITIAVASEIKRRAAAGEKAADIARTMGLPGEPVWRVASGRTFKRVS